VLALPKYQSESIIQVELPSNVDPHAFLDSIENFSRELEPEHEGTVVDAWVLSKDLSESKLSISQELNSPNSSAGLIQLPGLLLHREEC
jgi:hypothetical protein